jgi:oxygen-independent coproporphyrinogen III oxidase
MSHRMRTNVSLGLYISVPFCRTKCSYCNFASDVFSKSAYENYVVRLLEDIADARRFASQLGCALNEDDIVDSIYLGGGTPSLLDASQFRRVFAAIRHHFSVTADAEITVECAPGTLAPALIETLLQCDVNRVSLGVQSFVDQEAQSVGRLHQRATVLEEIARLREAGLANISIDLIAGLPHQTEESWDFSVAETIATGVPHVSVYMLEVDDDSRLGRELIAGGARYHAHFVPDDDRTADFYQHACETLEATGIKQYEISNFARVASHAENCRGPLGSSAGVGKLPNNESRHNLKYWTRQPYLGFGVDAHSMLREFVEKPTPRPVQAARSSALSRRERNPGIRMTSGNRLERDRHQAIRFAAPDSLDAYMKRAPHTVTPVSAQAAIEERFFLGLRLNRGIDLERLRTEFKITRMVEETSRDRGNDRGPAVRLAATDRHERVHHRGRVALQGRVATESTGALAPDDRSHSREVSRDAIAVWESAIRECVQDGLLEQQGSILSLTARGRLLSNEVFARFLIEETAEI